MNYGVGDEVVCIDAKPYKPHDAVTGTMLITGNIYKVIEFQNTFEGIGVRVTGITYPEFRSHASWRFIKLPKLTIDTEQEATA